MTGEVFSCGYFARGECRSCSEIERTSTEQVSAKEDRVREKLRSFPTLGGGPLVLQPTVSLARGGFRNRAKMSVTGTSESPRIGLLGEGTELDALDEGREILECPIHHPALNAIFQALPEFIRKYDLIPYRIAERKGELKGLIAFHSPVSGETYLRFILRSKECVSRIRKLLPELQARFPRLTCVSANIQPTPHAILEGKEEVFLTEKTSIIHEMGGIRFQLSPQAFVQTNATVATRLYAAAAEWIRDAKVEKGVELFCGQGAFSFFAAPHVRQFLGVEIHKGAVETANESAKALGLSHLAFHCLDAARGSDELEALVREYSPDLILANPPRKGMGNGIKLIERLRPRHFIYSSCSVDSLAADLQRLPDYRIVRAQVFDMFPHTAHFETLVWLTSDASA